MEIEKSPINLWNMNVNKFVKDNFLKEVTSLLVFEPSSQRFHPDGLYSEEIFGQLGSPERVSKLGYINLHTDVIVPIIYKNLLDVASWYENILKGTQYAVFDPDKGAFIPTDKDTELADTGFLYFMKYFEYLKFERNQSITRTDKIKVIEKSIREKTYKTDKMIVCPAGWRDVRIDNNGRVEIEDINNLYASLLALSKEVNVPISSPAIIAFFNNIRMNIQMKVFTLFQYFKNIAEGKDGYNQEKYAKRYVAWGTRNVITAPPLIADSPNSIDYLKQNETMMPLFQTAVSFMPLVVHYLNSIFITQIYSFGSIQVPAIDKETYNTVYIEVSPSDVTEALSSESKTKFVQDFINLELRQEPVVIKDINNKEYYLWLVYDLGDKIYLFRNMEDLEKLLNEEENIEDGDLPIKIEDCPELTPENTLPRWYKVIKKYQEMISKHTNTITSSGENFFKNTVWNNTIGQETFEVYHITKAKANDKIKKYGICSPRYLYQKDKELFHSTVYQTYLERVKRDLNLTRVTNEDILEWLDTSRQPCSSNDIWFSFIPNSKMPHIQYGNMELEISLDTLEKYAIGNPIVVFKKNYDQLSWKELKLKYNDLYKQAEKGAKKIISSNDLKYKNIIHMAVPSNPIPLKEFKIIQNNINYSQEEYKKTSGIDLSYIQLKFSKIPYYNNGEIDTDMNPLESAGSWTKKNFVVINPDCRLAFKYRHNNENYTTTLNQYWKKVETILAHELAHEIFYNYKNTDFVKEILKELETNKEFDTEYSITYKDKDPYKYNEERFCEYLALKVTENKLSEYKVDVSKIHALTNVEMLYIATFEACKDRYITITRYPCIEAGSTYPSKPVLGSTSPSRVVSFKSQYNPTVEIIYPNYPIYGLNTYLDSVVVHTCKTVGLNADHDK